jgi:hypothetical protein
MARRCEQCGGRLRDTAEGTTCDQCSTQALFRAAGSPRPKQRENAILALSKSDDPEVLRRVVLDLWGKSGLWQTPVVTCFSPLYVLAAITAFCAIAVLTTAWREWLGLSTNANEVALLALAAAGIGTVVGLMALHTSLHRRQRRQEDATIWILRDVTSPRSIPALARATREPNLADLAYRRLMELLPTATEADVAAFDSSDLDAITSLLYVRSATPRDHGLVDLAIGVLGFTAHEPTEIVLRRMVTRRADFRDLPEETVASAQRAIDAIRARLELANQKQTLLRATSSVEADPDRLLRAASAGEEPEEQLLRHSVGPADPDAQE